MRNFIPLLLSLLAMAGWSRAEFREWRNADGKAAMLNLMKVDEVNGEKVGEFSMRNGRRIKLAASKLSAEDAERLNAWKPGGDAEVVPASVFFSKLDGRLVKLQDDKLKRFDGFKEPAKYYLFYYTASWCPPCRAFTPTLVEWYQANKNDNFELVLITGDRNEAAMESYAIDKKMPWPQIELGKVMAFRDEFDHGVSGIPSLIVCKVDGEMLGNFRARLPELTNMVKD